MRGIAPIQSAAPAVAGREARPVGGRRIGSLVGLGRAAGAARIALLGLAMFALALAPRLAALDTYVTIDESRWVQRASDFHALVEQGDAEDTFIIGHPGVTTMWTALIGIGPERASRLSFREGRTDVTLRDGYFEALIAARAPFAVLASLGVAVSALLAWRLVGAGPALLAGALLALEPFLVAHARVVHLDSALTVYMSVCLLAGLIFWQAGGGWGYVLLAGAAGGLAFLTKAPSIFVLGFVPLVGILQSAFRRDRTARFWGRTTLALVLFGATAAVVALALWPALRADPAGTLLKMAQFTERVGGGEHDNFFLGQPLEDPGPFFYPAALLFRLAPLTLFGLLAVTFCWRRFSGRERLICLTLVAYCVGFGLMMTVAPKKFDRYLLPVFPMLGLLAGLAWWKVVAGVRASNHRIAAGSLLPIALIALQAVPLVAVHPYHLAYYSPLLGGGAMAQRVMLVGWGEGLDQVARYLDEQPRPLGAPTVATSYHRVLQAQLDGSAVPLERVRMADYVVPYVNTLQRGAEADVLAPYLAAGAPEATVRIQGIEYARVYRGPHHPSGETVQAEFGSRSRLASYLVAPGTGAVRPGEEIQVLLRWHATGGTDRATVALVGIDGRGIVVQDGRPVGADGPDEAGRPGEIHRLTVPSRTPPGEYRLDVTVEEAGYRLPVLVTTGAPSGAATLTLRSVTIEPGS